MKRAVLLSTVVVAGLFAAAQTATPSVQETLDLLGDGLTAAPLDAALTNIGNWQVTLEGTDDPALQTLGGQLGDLAEALQAESIDATEVGTLLSTIGVETSQLAGGDAQLASLGDLLTQAGGSLTGVDMSGGGASGGASEQMLDQSGGSGGM